MKNILLTLLAPTIFLFNGCTSAPPPKPPYKLPTIKDPKSMSVDELCSLHRNENWYELFKAKRTYGETAPATPEQVNVLKQQVVDARAELKRRKPFNKSEMRLVMKRSVRVGMSKKAFLCSWGAPDRINRSSYGDDQYVYEGSDYHSQYVYLRGNRVTAWQD